MSIIHAIVLGIIQGVGEFLPISSSGHLVVIPYLFGWDYQGLNFDIALHMGTLLADLAYFGKDWISIIGNAISHDHKKTKGEYPANIFWVILVASIPAAFAGYFLENLAENAERIGRIFRSRMEALQQKRPDLITLVRGKGLLNAVVINDSEDSKTAWNICMALAENGLLAKPTHGNIIRFAPPLVMTEEQIDDCCAIIEGVMSRFKK